MSETKGHKPPKVFISYSHDSRKHADKALSLTDKLRSEGIDAIIDQYEPWPEKGWAQWMLEQVSEATFVLMICTKMYYKGVMGKLAAEEKKGIKYEWNLINTYFHEDGAVNKRFLPVVFEQESVAWIPDPFRSMPRFCIATEEGYDELYRRLWNEPKTKKPKLGKRRKPTSKRKRRTDFFSGSGRGNSTIKKEILMAKKKDNGTPKKKQEDPKEQEKNARTLRDMVKVNGKCAKKFSEAEKLAKHIFDEKSGTVPLPYFTEHGEEHCRRVEKYLNDIIWGGKEDSKGDFVPTPEEAMYLLSADWLHDIGMMYCIFDGEKPSDLQDSTKVASLRGEHEYRTTKYILEKWKKNEGYNCSWIRQEKKWLANMCVYHRQKHPIETFGPVEPESKYDGRSIRLKTLAALVRLADVCHVDQSRAPGPLKRFYESLGMPPESVCYWERSELVSDVVFEHTQRKITLNAECPPKSGFDWGSFDLDEVVGIVREYVEEERFGVQKVISSYPNTCFLEADYHVDYVKADDIYQRQKCLALWPYLLDKPTSSCEAAAALTQMLLFAVNEGKEARKFGKVWLDKIILIMGETLKTRPFDFMIRNLCSDVKKLLRKRVTGAQRAEDLVVYLDRFLKVMGENCRKMAELAEDLISSNDVVIVYGYSSNITKFLERIRPRYEGRPLYVIECSKPINKVHLGSDENEKIMEFAERSGFDQISLVTMPALAQTLNELKRKEVPCKLLLGTHGVLGYSGFLCKVGSDMIVRKARECYVTVIAFAETTKFLTNGESDKDVAAHEKLFQSEEFIPHPVYKNVKCLRPKMDFIPMNLVDKIVTEKGVFSPTEKLLTARGSGKKGSSRV